MSTTITSSYRVSARAALLLAALLTATCGPYLPPAVAPPAPDPRLEPFRMAVQTYLDMTQPYRKEAAQAGNKVQGQDGVASGAETAVRMRANTLTGALARMLRPNAMQGNLVDPPAADIIRDMIRQAFEGPQGDLLRDALAEQNDEAQAVAPAPQIVLYERLMAPRVPPLLSEILPQLPKQLEYDFIGRMLLIRDVDADVVVDYVPMALPEPPPVGSPGETTPLPLVSASAPLPLPSMRGSAVFGVIGDSGTGDQAQESVAQAMLAYFTKASRFPFVLMLGDNLYDDDYTNEFLIPYKPLLERGVKFYAALGNHDRDLQIHFKPFNMQDRDYYSFDQGNARFAALNSNHPSDPAQAKWLASVFSDAGSKWRIAFFHHPLYSSGQHASESRDVIRPAMERLLQQAQVNLVLSGHEHLYERVAPQQGIRYFVSGGGGRRLYNVRASAFDEMAVSEHHFMVMEIAGDRLFYEAVTPGQKVFDCGVLYRTADAAAKMPDKNTLAWLDACSARLPRAGMPNNAATN